MAASISGIPVYEALVSGDNTGIVRISLVDDPAVITTWQKFSNAARPSAQRFAVADEEKRLIRGVIMRADFPLYRRDVDAETGKVTEYYLIFHADTIREMAEKFLADGRQNKVDTMHDGEEVPDVQMVQWFIKDTAAGVNPQGFDTDIADGSLFAEFHVINDEVWEQVKDGTFKGFSLDGFFNFAGERDQDSIDDLVDALAGQFHITDTMKIERLKSLLRAENARQSNNARPEKFGAVTTDRGPLEWDGDADLAVDDRVYVVDEEGNRSDAPSGEYATDTQVIVVEDGAVTEIREREAEEAPAEGEQVSAARTRFNRIRALFEASYEDRINAIVAAIIAVRGDGDWYIHECGDDFAVVCSWEGEGEKFYRYAISWNEDGTAVASDPQEVEQVFVPVGEGEAALEAAEEAENRAEEELRRQLTDARAEIATLNAQLEAARKRPLARPAHEEVKASAPKATPTGNAQLDRVAQLMSAK